MWKWHWVPGITIRVKKLKVTWTKDQLKNAPNFQYYKPPSRTSTTGSPSPTTGMGRPMAPAPSGR